MKKLRIAILAVGYVVSTTTLASAVKAELPTTNPTGFYFAGSVVDTAGKPIADVRIAAKTESIGGAEAYIGSTHTDAAGHFVIDRARALSGMSVADANRESQRLTFDHPQYVHALLEDLRKFPSQSRGDLQIVLQSGSTFQGRAVDPAGKPIGHAFATAFYGDEGYDYERRGETDANGEFVLRGLPDGAGEIRVVATGDNGTLLAGSLSQLANKLPITQPAVMSLKAVIISPQHVHQVLGMTLVDVDPPLAKQLFLAQEAGVLVLDPGPSFARFGIGDLSRCDEFWMVGDRRIYDVDNFVRRLIAERKRPLDGNANDGVRVVYNFIRLARSGSNTQYMKLTDPDVLELERFLTTSP